MNIRPPGYKSANFLCFSSGFQVKRSSLDAEYFPDGKFEEIKAKLSEGYEKPPYQFDKERGMIISFWDRNDEEVKDVLKEEKIEVEKVLTTEDALLQICMDNHFPDSKIAEQYVEARIEYWRERE